MLSSYFDVNYWDVNTTFNKNDICYTTGSSGYITYHYSLTDSNLGTDPRISSTWTDNFVWTPSYNTASEITISTQSLQNNYPMRTTNGINNELLKTTLLFENRNEPEAKAISHYVTVRRGTEPFQLSHYLFNGSGSLFVASELNIDYKYNNLYDVSFLIEQTPL